MPALQPRSRPEVSTRSPPIFWLTGSSRHWRPVKPRHISFSMSWCRPGSGKGSPEPISEPTMAFELGIPLSRAIEEQLIATLREKVPSLNEYSNEEIGRRVESADALGALGTLRRIPVLHNLNGLVDQNLLEAFDIDA